MMRHLQNAASEGYYVVWIRVTREQIELSTNRLKDLPGFPFPQNEAEERRKR
jgi:hypothetical protein